MEKRERQELFLVILRANAGNISSACHATGISRSAYNKWRNSDEWFAEELAEVQEFVVDFAESKLMENISANSSRDIHFFLSAKGRHRGYGSGRGIGDEDMAPQLASPTYPPEHASLADWEADVRRAKNAHQGSDAGGSAGGQPRLLSRRAGKDGHPDGNYSN